VLGCATLIWIAGRISIQVMLRRTAQHCVAEVDWQVDVHHGCQDPDQAQRYNVPNSKRAHNQHVRPVLEEHLAGNKHPTHWPPRPQPQGRHNPQRRQQKQYSKQGGHYHRHVRSATQQSPYFFLNNNKYLKTKK
jgi:hypothetical protein